MSATLAALTGGEIILDETSRTVRVRGEVLTLTLIEYALFLALAAQAGHVVARDEIFRHAWGYSMAGGALLVDLALRRLQVKLEVNPKHPGWLKKVRGGYRLGGGDDFPP